MQIKVAEHFGPTIQGEGKSVGAPAIFLRLSGCLLECKWCDTLEVWKQGTKYDLEQLTQLFKSAGYLEYLDKGYRLVITGGDPLIQQKALVEWFHFLFRKGIPVYRWNIEVETEGIIQPDDDLAKFILQWNVSPKLMNSGMELEKRIKIRTLIWHSLRGDSYFKFPVSHVRDLSEVEAIATKAAIPNTHIYLMPVCDNEEDHRVNSKEVAEWCKLHGYNYSPRLQLFLWNKTVGV